jgi:hypothetical protein
MYFVLKTSLVIMITTCDYWLAAISPLLSNVAVATALAGPKNGLHFEGCFCISRDKEGIHLKEIISRLITW